MIKVINTWIKVEEKFLEEQENGTWSFGRHYGALEALYKVKLLLLGVEETPDENIRD